MEDPTSPRNSATSDHCTLQLTPLSCIPRDRDTHVRDCSTPPLEGSTDDMSDKEANKPMLFRCLLLLLPVAIPIIVYLKDIDAMRRIFLTAFILLLIIVLSCLMAAVLRRRRRNLEGQTSNSEIARELAHRHFMAVTHRFLPRPPLPLTHGRCHRDCEFNEENRRIHGHYRSSFGRMPSHYHLTSTLSRSPSPQSHSQAIGPLPLLSLHIPRFDSVNRDEIQIRCDDPPSYEDVILCPPQTPHRNHRYQQVSLPETPPPSYEIAVG